MQLSTARAAAGSLQRCLARPRWLGRPRAHTACSWPAHTGRPAKPDQVVLWQKRPRVSHILFQKACFSAVVCARTEQPTCVLLRQVLSRPTPPHCGRLRTVGQGLGGGRRPGRVRSGEGTLSTLSTPAVGGGWVRIGGESSQRASRVCEKQSLTQKASSREKAFRAPSWCE